VRKAVPICLLRRTRCNLKQLGLLSILLYFRDLLDELQDFMLRRTTDGYLELIEIKTPLAGKPLFLEDDSHASLYPRSELSVVLGQVTHYLEKLDAARHVIKSEDEEDVNKICAKIIIGRDGNKDQKNALR